MRMRRLGVRSRDGHEARAERTNKKDRSGMRFDSISNDAHASGRSERLHVSLHVRVHGRPRNLFEGIYVWPGAWYETLHSPRCHQQPMHSLSAHRKFLRCRCVELAQDLMVVVAIDGTL